jgi:ankyrin repeat protein
MLERRDNIEPWHTNTCEWILELDEYQTWKSQPRGLLWIKGKPGAGKSTLMAFLFNHFEQEVSQGLRLDFFFTARGTELQRTPLGMFKSLLRQIYYYDSTVRYQLRQIYEQRSKQFGGQKWEWPRVVLEKLLADLILESASRQHVIVFIDALDEAGAESARQLVAYFHRLIDRAGKVAFHVCISCRHYPIVKSARAIEVCMEDHNQDDISAYIKDAFPETDVGEGPSEDTEMEQLLAEQLIQQSNGSFQWAHLIIPLAQRKVFEGESLQDIQCWLKEVPDDLDETYTYVLCNVIEVSNREQSFLFFLWVCLAERPLTVTEMRYALAVSNAQVMPPSKPKPWEMVSGYIESNGRMERRIKALSGGLAEVLQSGNDVETIQVVHQSVNDFLRTKGLGLLFSMIDTREWHVDGDSENIILQSQRILYRSCLVYLAGVPALQDKYSFFWEEKERLAENHPFLTYATVNTFVHARKAAVSRLGVLLNQELVDRWVDFYQMIDGRNAACPASGTKLLHMAAAAGLPGLVKSLSDEDIATMDDNGYTAFHLAARSGDIVTGQILLEKGADHEIKMEFRTTPLEEAARSGQVKFLEWLLEVEGSLQTLDRGSTALQMAVVNGHCAIVEILLAAGADMNANFGDDESVLQAAAYEGQTEIVRLLLNAGADVNTDHGIALQAAAWEGHTETVKFLLNAGADPNCQRAGIYGNPLQAAAAYGNIEIFKLLLNAGADVNSQGGRFGNALQAAAVYGNTTEKVRLLLSAGAEVNFQGGAFGNALQAAACQRKTEIVQLLLDSGASINAEGGQYGNALQAAAFTGDMELVQMLVDSGADINAQGGEYGSALQAAAYHGNTKTVRLLLNSGASINFQGGKYSSALQAAVSHGNTKTVRLLLDSGASINDEGGKYGSALQAAAYHGNTEIVRLLLDSGANINAQGGKYGSVLQAATENGHTKIVQMLQRLS